MGRFTRRNLRNIKCVFEEKTGADLNPAHREPHRKPIRTVVVLAAIVACLALAAFSKPIFSPLDGDEFVQSAVYEGDGIVSVHVVNRSDKELRYQEQVKLMIWETSEEVVMTGGTVKMENTVFPAHSEGTMTVDLSKAYDIKALEASDTDGVHYYLLLTNQSFLFGQDWMCSVSFADGEEVPPAGETEPIAEETLPPEPVEVIIAEEIEEELRFYFEDAYADQAMRSNEKNTEYMLKVQELLAQFDGTVVPPAEPMLIVGRTPDGVVFDESYPMERQYELVGEHWHSIDGCGRIVAGFNSPTGWEHALTLETLLPSYKGEVGGSVTIPLIYMFTYEVAAVQQENTYAFIYGQLLSFEEMEGYKVYEDEQYAVYEVTDLFYTDLDAYIDYFLTTRSDIYCDEQIRQRIHNMYDYFKDPETLGSLFYYNLPE